MSRAKPRAKLPSDTWTCRYGHKHPYTDSQCNRRPRYRIADGSLEAIRYRDSRWEPSPAGPNCANRAAHDRRSLLAMVRAYKDMVRGLEARLEAATKKKK